MDFANAKRENVAMGKKVMIVEGNEFNLKLFTDLLRGHQFEVQGVRDGRLALDQAHIFAPDLVIMDIQLPHVRRAAAFPKLTFVHRAAFFRLKRQQIRSKQSLITLGWISPLARQLIWLNETCTSAR